MAATEPAMDKAIVPSIRQTNAAADCLTFQPSCTTRITSTITSTEGITINAACWATNFTTQHAS